MTCHHQRVLLAIIAAALLMAGLLEVQRLVHRVVDCPPGQLYSLTRFRCVGSLEFDVR
jgi:hypothetical protein